MTFATVAIGERHRHLAERLAISFVAWNWPRLVVISDAAVACHENIIISPDIAAPRGRGAKCRFASFFPASPGPVWFIDADCEAVGPFLGTPELKESTLSGIIRATYLSKRPTYHLCSAALGFPDHAYAAALCAAWWKAYAAAPIATDEIALRHALDAMGRPQVIPCGTMTEPLANLRHTLATTRPRGGWFNFQDVYAMAVDTAPHGATLVELGIWTGDSLAYLSRKAIEAAKNLSVYAYDQFDPAYYLGAPKGCATSDEWLTAVQARVPAAIVRRSDASAAAAHHADRSVHMAFIDAGHAEENVSADIAAWWPKISRGGFLAGHDLDHPRHPGVRTALEKSGLSWVPLGKCSWVIYR
jgi:hypothetical protein